MKRSAWRVQDEILEEAGREAQMEAEEFDRFYKERRSVVGDRPGE